MTKLTWMRGAASLGLASAIFTGGTHVFAASVSTDSTGETYSDSGSGTNAVLVDGSTVTLTNPTVTKTGDSSSEDADFYGTNAAVLAKNGASLTIEGGSVTTDGSHANAVFAYGSGTTINISGTTIQTAKNNSGGLMTTGGAVMNASDLTVSTSGNSSAAIRSDRGGGTVTVIGGTYSTSGVGSPVIYSTADITVSDASLTSTTSEGVVIEGANSVTLNDCTLEASNTQKNGQSTVYTGLMIYQSMSGDAAAGAGSFTASGGTIINNEGSLFYVTNTTALITLNGVTIRNGDTLLTIAQGPWGTTGRNGGTVTFTADSQVLQGLITVDAVSALNLELANGSSYTGRIDNAGNVYVSLDDDSTWTLTGDSAISSLTCDEDAIDLNGYTLTVGGTTYEEGTASSGSEVAEVSAGSSSQDAQPENGTMPSNDGQDVPADEVPQELENPTEMPPAEEMPETTEQQHFDEFIEQAAQLDPQGILNDLIEALKNAEDEDGLFSIEDILRIAETLRQKTPDQAEALPAAQLLQQAEEDDLIEENEFEAGEKITMTKALRILNKAMSGRTEDQVPSPNQSTSQNQSTIVPAGMKMPEQTEKH
jgi:hypothetical protein